MKVSEIMRKAIVIDDNISLKDVAKIMSRKNIGSLIVVKGDKISGIITERDVMRNLDNINSKVKNIMSKKVVTVDASEDVHKVSGMMINNKIKRLPVMSNKKLRGVVTMTDVLAHSDIDFEDEFMFN